MAALRFRSPVLRNTRAPFLKRIEGTFPLGQDAYPFNIPAFVARISPQRQLSFLRILHDLSTPGHAQFIIATHSPMLLAFPGAVILDLDGDAIRETTYQDIRHFQVTRDFLNGPERFFKHLLASEHTADD